MWSHHAWSLPSPFLCPSFFNAPWGSGMGCDTVRHCQIFVPFLILKDSLSLWDKISAFCLQYNPLPAPRLAEIKVVTEYKEKINSRRWSNSGHSHLISTLYHGTSFAGVKGYVGLLRQKQQEELGHQFNGRALPNVSKTIGSIPSMKKQEDEEGKDWEGKRGETQLFTAF